LYHVECAFFVHVQSNFVFIIESLMIVLKLTNHQGLVL